MTFYLQALFRYYSLSSWRKTDQGGDIEWNTKSEEKLMNECKTKPIFGQDKIRILFVGFSTHGKTTSISNFRSVFLKGLTYTGGCYKAKALDNDIAKCVTQDYKEISVRTSEGPAYFSFIDSPGMAVDADNSKKIQRLKEFITGPDHMHNLNGTEKKLQPCSLVFVMDATKIYRMSITTRMTIADILNHAEKNDVAVEFLLTKCDLVDKRLQDPSNIPKIFHSPDIRKCVMHASQIFSDAPKNRIHPVINNTNDTTHIKEQKILHLLAMRSILANAKAVLESRPPK